MLYYINHPMSCPSFNPHDHAACIADALAVANRICKAKGVRLTPQRQRVLELLLSEPKALGAYDILARLSQEGMGSQPPIVYRALDFLTEHGLAHRLERLNAFVACASPGASHRPAFMICRACSAVAETPGTAAPRGLDAAAKATGFIIEETMVEAMGLCPSCVETG